MMRLIIRGTLLGKLQFQNRVDVDGPELVGRLAAEHVTAMGAGLLDMIEIEFLDEPNANERFFRIGTSPTGMICPIEFDLSREQ